MLDVDGINQFLEQVGTVLRHLKRFGQNFVRVVPVLDHSVRYVVSDVRGFHDTSGQRVGTSNKDILIF